MHWSTLYEIYEHRAHTEILYGIYCHRNVFFISCIFKICTLFIVLCICIGILCGIHLYMSTEECILLSIYLSIYSLFVFQFFF